jgi:hypothetical protein
MATVERATATATKRAKATDRVGNGDGGKSDGNGDKEGDGKSGKSNGDSIEEGADGGDGNGNKVVGQGMATATKRAMGWAMATVTRVADAKETGDSNYNYDSN